MSNKIQYFEDYEIGQKGATATRTLTETDLVTFAYLTGDYNRSHTDRHYAADNVYKGRIGHGLLGSSWITGMLSICAPHTIGRSVPGAYLYGFEANYHAAVKLDDTIHVEWRIGEKADDPSHKGFGLVKTAFQVLLQDGTQVYDGVFTTIVRKKAEAKAKLQLKSGTPWEIKDFGLDRTKPYYAEDYPVGGTVETEGRTITEADVLNFANFSGDHNPQHVDAEFARKGLFGERIAQAVFIFSSAVGLYQRYRSQIPEPPIKPVGKLNDIATFFLPVKIGDTIHARYKILNTRVSKSNPKMGIVTFGLQVINQKNEVTQEGSTLMVIPSRAALQT